MNPEKNPYQWRKLTEQGRKELLELRRQRGHPRHSPPHRSSNHIHYLVSAACYEHQPYIGSNFQRLNEFSDELCSATKNDDFEYCVAWCVLPNHYHLLIATNDILSFLSRIGKMHGRTSFKWNGEDKMRGRKVWFNAVERAMRSERHFWATLNYIHHNPVHHGYAMKWEEWPFSSARDYISGAGRSAARETWFKYPIRDYGKGWDDALL